MKEYNSPSDVQILLVDDDELACRSLQQTLRKCGYGVISCNSGPKALELLWASVRTNTSRGESRSTFDLVMLDVLMPDMDGLEVINAIRQSPMLRGIPIAAVSANTDINSIQQAMNIGANEYMVKPVSSNMVQPLVIKLQQWQDGELRSDMDGSSEESKSSSVASHGSSSAICHLFWKTRSLHRATMSLEAPQAEISGLTRLKVKDCWPLEQICASQEEDGGTRASP